MLASKVLITAGTPGHIYLDDKQAKCLKNIASSAGCWWLMPVILATQETEIRNIAARSQPRQIVPRDPILKKKKTLHKKGLVEWLKVWASSSSPSTTKIKNKKKPHSILISKTLQGLQQKPSRNSMKVVKSMKHSQGKYYPMVMQGCFLCTALMAALPKDISPSCQEFLLWES
jgi:hypothetical protein